MSELAFNANGDSFEVPAAVTGWRVRRMKPRGAPELVYGRDGRPLTIPIESDMDDLRDAVGLVGKYRLDPINDDGKTVDGVSAAYIQVVKPERAEPATSMAPATSTPADDTLREAMRMNTELAKAVIDRFPEMMQAAAVLLRAADGAGLPAREPRAIDEEGDEDEESPERPGFDLGTFIGQMIPLLVTGLGGSKAKIPALGEMLDWRKAAPGARAKADKARPEAPQAEPVSGKSTTVDAETAGVEPMVPPLDPQTMAHFVAVQSALAPEESAIAREVAKELSPTELRAWFDELSALSVPDAVARVRKLISGFGKTDGAS